MAQYLLMCIQPEAGPGEPTAGDAVEPALLELHQSLREAGILLDAQRLRPIGSAPSVRVQGGQTEITDGPFAITKEYLAGYYLVECAHLDEAVAVAAQLTRTSGTIEVRPVIPQAEWAGDPR